MTNLLIFLAAALVIGIVLILGGCDVRRQRGLGQGRTVDLDDRTLYSARYQLAGRPDRIMAGGIPEEWKSSLRVYDSHKTQMGVYFILIEEDTGVVPTHGFIVLGNKQRVRIENTPALRAWVLKVADQIWAARLELAREIPVRQPPAKCRGCGLKEACGQRTG